MCFMKKYKINSIKYNNSDDAVMFVINNKGAIQAQVVPVDFIRGLQVGDDIRSLGFGGFPIVWSCRDKLHLTITPFNENLIRNYASQNFDLGDGIYFRYLLARALSVRGIKPKFSTSKNLRLFLYGKKTELTK